MNSREEIRKIIREALMSEKHMFSNFAMYTDPLIAKISGTEVDKGNGAQDKEGKGDAKDVWSNHTIWKGDISIEDVKKNLDEFKQEIIQLYNGTIAQSAFEKEINEKFKKFIKLITKAKDVYSIRGSHDEGLISQLNKLSAEFSVFLKKNAKKIRNPKIKELLRLA